MKISLLVLWAALASAAQPPHLFLTPSSHGHKPVVAAIAGARESVDMTMYHLTDAKVIKALSAAAARGVRVRVILDQASLKEAKYRRGFRKLASGGVSVRASSPQFSLTHAKTLLIDGSRSLVMTMNLGGGASSMRDYGLLTEDPAVAAALGQVFETDWANAQSNGHDSPMLNDPDVVLSPVNSERRLVELIDSAQKDLIATVENLGDPALQEALVRAAGRGVKVRLIVPMCDLNADPLWNYRFLGILTRGGVQARVMPYPATPRHPYMHAKTLLADGRRAYLGSINYSVNSMTMAREFGLLFTDPEPIAGMAKAFAADWQAAVEAPDPPPAFCPVPGSLPARLRR